MTQVSENIENNLMMIDPTTTTTGSLRNATDIHSSESTSSSSSSKKNTTDDIKSDIQPHTTSDSSPLLLQQLSKTKNCIEDTSSKTISFTDLDNTSSSTSATDSNLPNTTTNLIHIHPRLHQLNYSNSLSFYLLDKDYHLDKQSENLSTHVNRACLGILTSLQRHHQAGPFLFPFNPKDWNISTLKSAADLSLSHTTSENLKSSSSTTGHITNPTNTEPLTGEMSEQSISILQALDLTAIQKKLEADLYEQPIEFFNDITKLLDNYRLFWKPGTKLNKMANNVEKYFFSLVSKLSKKQRALIGIFTDLESAQAELVRESLLSLDTPLSPSSTTSLKTIDELKNQQTLHHRQVKKKEDLTRSSKRIAQKKFLPVICSPPHSVTSGDGEDPVGDEQVPLSANDDAIPSPVSPAGSEDQPITPVTSPSLPILSADVPTSANKENKTPPQSPHKNHLPTPEASPKKPPPVTKPAKKTTSASSGRVCAYCGARSTPMWRHGPPSYDPLCNSCGVKWRRGRILTEFKHSTMVSPVKRRAPSLPSAQSSNGRSNFQNTSSSLKTSSITNSGSATKNVNNNNNEQRNVTPHSKNSDSSAISIPVSSTKLMMTRSRTTSSSATTATPCSSDNRSVCSSMKQRQNKRRSAFSQEEEELNLVNSTPSSNTMNPPSAKRARYQQQQEFSSTPRHSNTNSAVHSSAGRTKFIKKGQMIEENATFTTAFTFTPSSSLSTSSLTYPPSSRSTSSLTVHQSHRTPLHALHTSLKGKQNNQITIQTPFPGPIYSKHYDMLDMDSDEEDPDPVFHQPFTAFKSPEAHIVEKTVLFSQNVKHMPMEKLIDVVSILKDHVSSDFVNALTNVHHKKDLEVDSSLLDEQTWSKLCSLI